MARPGNSARRLLVLALALLPLFVLAQPGSVVEPYATTYFAPVSVPTVGIWRMRTPEGGIRQFESTKGGCSRMESEDGWQAGADVRKAWVQAPSGTKPSLKITYEGGIPVSAAVGGKVRKLAKSDSVAYTNGSPAWVSWPMKWTKDPFSEFSASLWRKDRRLQLWFGTGNRAGAFLAMLFLAGMSLVLGTRRLTGRIVGIVLSLLALVGVFLTQSRGALVAMLASAAVVEVCWLHGRGLLTRKRLLVAGLVTVLIGVVVTVLFVAVLPRGIMSYVRSDGLRWDMLRGFPRMMCDAPWGWGLGQCGAAYADWYNSPDEWRYQACLFSDHLSMLADFGWLGGGLYLLAVLAGFFGLMRLAWIGGPTAPLGLWCALAVAACWNPVFAAPTILWLPLASLVFLIRDRRWMRGRFWLKPLVASALCSAAILLVVWAIGESVSYAPRISRQGRAVLVNGDSPKIWLVADDDVLGSRFMPKEEIRWFYWANPKAPAVGIVHDLDDLGRTGVRRLVLSGRHCGEYLRRFRERAAGLAVPPEIVFLSPGFAAPEIPRQLHERSRVTMVLGEFAARYDPGFGSDPLVTMVIVKGAELYVPGWMRYFVPMGGRESGR